MDGMNKGAMQGTATHGDKGAHTDSPADGRPTQFTPDQRSETADHLAGRGGS